MSRIRTLSLLIAATALVAGCSVPTSPAPAASPGLQAPSFNSDTPTDTTPDRSGYQVGHG